MQVIRKRRPRPAVNPEITACWEVGVELTFLADLSPNLRPVGSPQPAAAALAASVAAYEPELVDKVFTNIS